jgi:hypothetical protein
LLPSVQTITLFTVSGSNLWHKHYKKFQ